MLTLLIVVPLVGIGIGLLLAWMMVGVADQIARMFDTEDKK